MTRLFHVIFIVFVCLFCVKQSNAQDDHLIDSLYKQLDESKRDTFQMKIYRSIGDFYMYKNPIKAIHYFEKANELAIQNNRTLDIASNYYSIGYCSLEKGNFDHAIENYLKSVRLYIQMNDVKRLTNAYLSLSNVYSRAKKYPKAYEYLQMAEQQFGISNDSLQQCAIIQQKGNYFFQQKMFDSAQY